MNPPREVVYPSAMNVKDVLGLYETPFTELVYRAASVHRAHFDPAEIQLSTLLSVKTGGCPEDCAYCPQSRRYATGVADQEVLALQEVLETARRAKSNGASRFCMGAAWRGPKDRDLQKIVEFVKEVKALGLETCVTLGMLKTGQAERLRAAGLDYYNHNLDTSPEFYGEIISTRAYRDRLQTLEQGRAAGIRVSCGAHRDAQGVDPALRRPRNHARRRAGAVLSRRRQFGVLRREAAHHRKSRSSPRP